MNTGAINDIRKAAEAVRIAFNNYVGAQSADEKRQLWKVWDKASSNLHELLSPAHETVLELCRLAEIGERHESRPDPLGEALNSGDGVAAIDRHLLLSDREAICERLDLLTNHAREYMPDLCDSVCRDDHHQREFMGNHGAKGGSAFSGVKSAIEGFEELLSELRGAK